MKNLTTVPRSTNVIAEYFIKFKTMLKIKKSKIIFFALLAAMSSFAFGQFGGLKIDQVPNDVINLNQKNITYSIALGNQNSDLNKCAINLQIEGVGDVDLIATAPNYVVQFSIPIEKNKNHLVNLKGKIKWGIRPNNAPACLVDDQLLINQIILNEWQPIKDKFQNSYSLRCIHFGFVKLNESIEGPPTSERLFPRPTDLISKRIFDVCDGLLTDPLKANITCNITGVSEKTFCNEVYYSPARPNTILNLQEAVNAVLDGQTVKKGFVETSASKANRLLAEDEKKRLEEETLKKKVKQQDIANKVEEFLFNKKWSNKDSPCNLNGGDYYIYTNRGPSGAQMILRGKKVPDSKQSQFFNYRVIDENTVIYVHEVFAKGNDLMMKFVRNPSTLMGRRLTTIKIISSDRLEYSVIDQMIDIEYLLKTGRIQYEARNESGFRKLCKF
jgi:hypothetical protein